jgi:hypothetical protein
MCGRMTRSVVQLPRFETGCQVTVLSLISQPLPYYVTIHAKVGHHPALGPLTSIYIAVLEGIQLWQLLQDTVGLIREILQGSAKRIHNRGAQHIMEATEGLVGGLQLRHFLCGLKGRMRVSVYLEDRVSTSFGSSRWLST